MWYMHCSLIKETLWKRLVLRLVLVAWLELQFHMRRHTRTYTVHCLDTCCVVLTSAKHRQATRIYPFDQSLSHALDHSAAWQMHKLKPCKRPSQGEPLRLWCASASPGRIREFFRSVSFFPFFFSPLEHNTNKTSEMNPELQVLVLLSAGDPLATSTRRVTGEIISTEAFFTSMPKLWSSLSRERLTKKAITLCAG